MAHLDTFLSKLTEYGTNNISAFEGHIQYTHNEREDLKLLFTKLEQNERPKAVDAAKAKGLDVSTWR